MVSNLHYPVSLLMMALALGFPACRGHGRGPTDGEIVTAVRKTPPMPPTLGPTYLASVEVVEVQERGAYNSDGGYWPVRVRVKGTAKLKVTNPFQLGLVDEREREKTEAVDFIERAECTKDDFGTWRVTYDYREGPEWRRVRPPLRD